MFQAYYQLTKPGIIYGNLLTAAAGFVYASQSNLNVLLLLITLLGIAGVIASACVANNILDRDIDAHMERTKQRALVTGVISVRRAIAFSFVLAWAGFGLLAVATNTLTIVMGLIGWVSYVVIYTYAKRKTSYGTLLGSISGATSLVAGYTAVTGRLDQAALILFAIMATWQLPHFYAIAIFREGEYKQAKVPVLPLVKGVQSTKIQICLWIIAFILSCAALTLTGNASTSFLVVMAVVGVGWLVLALSGFKTASNDVWARRVFRVSLIALVALSCMLVLNGHII